MLSNPTVGNEGSSRPDIRAFLTLKIAELSRTLDIRESIPFEITENPEGVKIIKIQPAGLYDNYTARNGLTAFSDSLRNELITLGYKVLGDSIMYRPQGSSYEIVFKIQEA